MRSAVRLALCLVPLALVACSSGADRGDLGVSFPSDDSARALPPLGPEDVAVTSTDGALTLALVGDTVRMQLADSLRQRVQAEVAQSVGKDSGGLGGMIARSVGTVVGGAMGAVVRLPVQDVENLRYADGRIQFRSRGNLRIAMSGRDGADPGQEGEGRNAGDDAGRDGARFSEADGRRFVEAVQRRQQRLRSRRPAENL